MPPPFVFNDEEPPAAESMALGSEDNVQRARRAPPRVMLVMLPTKVELEEGYVYRRDF